MGGPTPGHRTLGVQRALELLRRGTPRHTRGCPAPCATQMDDTQRCPAPCTVFVGPDRIRARNVARVGLHVFLHPDGLHSHERAMFNGTILASPSASSSGCAGARAPFTCRTTTPRICSSPSYRRTRLELENTVLRAHWHRKNLYSEGRAGSTKRPCP